MTRQNPYNLNRSCPRAKHPARPLAPRPTIPPCPARVPPTGLFPKRDRLRSEEHTSELQSLRHLVCRLLLEKKQIPSPGAGMLGTESGHAHVTAFHRSAESQFARHKELLFQLFLKEGHQQGNHPFPQRRSPVP